MGFQSGLSGLNTAAKNLDVIGNNVANATVVGFKGSSAQFADVFAKSLAGAGATAIGIGSKVSNVSQQFSQGNISVSSNPLDFAINGKGFFRMSNNGTVSYTRNGQFHSDADGYVINNEGLRLTGYGVDSSGNIVATSPTDIQISTSDIAPVSTSTFSTVLNLDAGSSVPATAVFSQTDPTSYTNSTAGSVYDSLGKSHVFTMFFVKTATAGQWSLRASVDGTALTNVALAGGAAGAATTINFNSSGALTTSMPITVALTLSNGAVTPLSFNLDLTGTTQYGSSFGVTSLSQNGYAAGRLAGFSVSADGTIQGRYSNGQSKNLAQVILADFANPQGLKPLGNNLWEETAGSGLPVIGPPSSGTLGALQSSAVEDSNVDLTAELVNMITAQRVYQANAQSIKTQDAVLQTLVNLR